MTDVVNIDVSAGKHTYTVGKGEKRTFVLVLAEDGLSTQDLEIELIGEGAEAQILGVLIGRNNSEFVLNTLQRHTAPRTVSDLLVKGVFSEQSKLRYRGLIEIKKRALNANAFQQQNNLVLAPKVDIDTRPQLEIEANEVRCTHASTTGRIDEEELYYLRTRGIDENMAKKIIVEGFLHEVVERIENTEVKSEIEEKILQLLD